MKIAIIGAMQEEIDYLLAHLEKKEEVSKLKHLFYLGTYQGLDLVVVRSGVGKVSSGILFSALVHSYPDLDLVINIGVSGGVVGRIKTAEIVVASRVAYADVDIRAGGKYVYGQMAGYPPFFESRVDLIKKLELTLPYKVGTILSGDSFYSNKKMVSELLDNYFVEDEVLALDMESAAFGQCAHFFNLPFIAIRAISDVIGEESQVQDFLDNLELACTNSNRFLLEILKDLKKID